MRTPRASCLLALVLCAVTTATATAGTLQVSPVSAQWLGEAISSLGGATGMLASHALLYSRDRPLAVRSARAVVTASAITYALKCLLGRERPDLAGSTGRFTGPSLEDERHAMPSGHTAAAFAMAGVLADEDPEHAVGYYAAATMVGLSRVYLQRHWPGDVVAGALIGLTVSKRF